MQFSGLLYAFLVILMCIVENVVTQSNGNSHEYEPFESSLLVKRLRGEPIRFGKRSPREPIRFGKRFNKLPGLEIQYDD